MRVLLLKSRAVTESASIRVGLLVQTAARRLGKRTKQVVVQRCGLTSDRQTAPTPPALDHPRPSQDLWTLKMHAKRIRLEERRRRCDTEHDGAFALQRSFRGSSEIEQPWKTALDGQKTRKFFFDGARSPVRQR